MKIQIKKYILNTIYLFLIVLFFIACSKKKEAGKIIKTLDKKGYILIPDKGKTPLMLASENGNIKEVLSLVKSGANIGAKDKQGRSALWYACFCSNFDIARILLSNGANINSVYDGETLLLSSSRNQQVEMVGFLLKYGANPNITDINGESPLMVVFERIEKAKEFKNTSLHNFIKSDKNKIFRIIELLIRHRAKVNYVNNRKSVLDYALKTKQKSIINILLKHGAKTVKELETEKAGNLIPKKEDKSP